MATVALSGIITPTNVVTAASTTTLTNKTISGASNTLSNIPLSTAVTGTLPIANGGTGTTSTTFVNAATNVTGTLPIANGGTGTTSTTFVNAATNVTGTLPVANGGTGTTSTTFVNAATNVTGTLPIANGGTNSTATPTAGGVVYGTGTAQAVTSAGTSGYFLKSNGASAPTWVAASSGALTLLSTVTASNSATVDIETTFSSTYGQYMLVMSNVDITASASDFWFQMKISGSYITSYTYTASVEKTPANNSTYSGATQTVAAFNGVKMLAGTDCSTTAGTSLNCVMYIHAPSDTTYQKHVEWIGKFVNSSDILAKTCGTGGNTGTGALTGLRFYKDSGNITSGTFRLYGIANT